MIIPNMRVQIPAVHKTDIKIVIVIEESPLTALELESMLAFIVLASVN